MTPFLSYLIVFGLSAVPVIELKGSIPVGMSLGLPAWECFLIAIFGSMILSPLIILFTRQVLTWLKDSRVKVFSKFGHWQENRLAAKGGKLEKYSYWFLFLLVAIPIPTTGVWTGSMLAGLFDIRMKIALPIIFVGNIVAGLLVWLIWGFVAA